MILLHDVSSTSRLSDFFRTIIAYRDYIEMFIISKVTGAAAQFGIAEISKGLFKSNIRFLLLGDIHELNDVFPEYQIIQFTATYGKEFKSFQELAPSGTGKTVLAFSGSDIGFSKNELLPGAILLKPFGIGKELPPQSYLAIALHLIASSSV